MSPCPEPASRLPPRPLLPGCPRTALAWVPGLRTQLALPIRLYVWQRASFTAILADHPRPRLLPEPRGCPLHPCLPCCPARRAGVRHLSQSLCEHQCTVLRLHRSKSVLSCALLRSTALPRRRADRFPPRREPKVFTDPLSPSPNLLPVSALSLFWMFPVKRIIQGRFCISHIF